MKVLEELKERKVLTSIDIQYRRNLYYRGVKSEAAAILAVKQALKEFQKPIP